jgi:2-oxoglutarate ferredoxin oxidoreductase subunit gamma
MEYYELMIAGTGGRGVLLIGRLLAKAGMDQHKHVLFFPNYAPAMRGGESECTVILSDNYIGCSVKYEPEYAIAMTDSALQLMQNRIKAGGSIIADSSVISDKVVRNDINIFYIPATEKAVELGGNQAANMVLLGSYVENTKALPLQLVEKALDDMLQDKSKSAILDLNKKALNEGARLMAQYQ